MHLVGLLQPRITMHGTTNILKKKPHLSVRLCGVWHRSATPPPPVTFASGSSVMISALVTPQTPRHRFHLFSMGPPRHSAHETWCFRFITRTKIPPFIFQRLGLHYIVIVSSNGSLSHLSHWCCTEIYDFCFPLVTLARKLSHRSIEQHKDTWLIWLICVLCLLLVACCFSQDRSGVDRLFYVLCTKYKKFTQGGVITNVRRSPYFNSRIIIIIIIIIYCNWVFTRWQ